MARSHLVQMLEVEKQRESKANRLKPNTSSRVLLFFLFFLILTLTLTLYLTPLLQQDNFLSIGQI